MEMQVRPFRAEDEDRVVTLWRRCNLVRPVNDPHADIRRKLTVRPELFLVGEVDGTIVASVMAGYEGHRGWLNYVAVDPDYQRRGLARAIVAEAENRLRATGCPKINVQIRTANQGVVEFYRKVGYSIDEVICVGKRLVVDEPGK